MRMNSPTNENEMRFEDRVRRRRKLTLLLKRELAEVRSLIVDGDEEEEESE